MGVSVKTIETYRARMKTILGISNRAQLLAQAVEWSLERRWWVGQPKQSTNQL
jgi:DNA-binding CsgD family transcriptional regulator